MKKLYTLLSILVIVSYSCTKEHAVPSQPNTPGNADTSNTVQVKSTLSITINGNVMQVDTFTFNRSTSTLDIVGMNASKRVALSVTNFWQQIFGSYLCQYQVFYATRPDTTLPWNNVPISNTDYSMNFVDWMPMQDGVVKGDFSAGFNNDSDSLNLHATFILLFK